MIHLATTIPTIQVAYFDLEDAIDHEFYLPLPTIGGLTPRQIEQKAAAVYKHLLKIVGAKRALTDREGETPKLVVLIQTAVLNKCDVTVYVTRYWEPPRATEGPDGKRTYSKGHYRLGWSTSKAKLHEGLRATKKGKR